MKHLIPFLILLFLTSCSILRSNDEEVTARSRAHTVIIENDTSERVYYFVVGRQVAARINWAPTLDPDHSVAAGDSRGVAFHEIAQEQGGEEEAIVYWWHADRQGETEKPGELHSIVVALE